MSFIQLGRNKSRIQTIAAIALMFFMASSLLFGASNVKALTTSAYPSYCFVAANPNPLGANQTALVDFWMADVTAGSIGSTGNFYSGVTVVITQPDGTSVTKGPYTLNSLATGFFDFTPATTGNYTFQMIYPGQTFAAINSVYASCKRPSIHTCRAIPTDSCLSASPPANLLLVTPNQRTELPVEYSFW